MGKRQQKSRSYKNKGARKSSCAKSASSFVKGRSASAKPSHETSEKGRGRGHPHSKNKNKGQGKGLDEFRQAQASAEQRYLASRNRKPASRKRRPGSGISPEDADRPDLKAEWEKNRLIGVDRRTLEDKFKGAVSVDFTQQRRGLDGLQSDQRRNFLSKYALDGPGQHLSRRTASLAGGGGGAFQELDFGGDSSSEDGCGESTGPKKSARNPFNFNPATIPIQQTTDPSASDDESL